MDASQRYRLSNGVEIPCIGYGTAPLNETIGQEMPVGIDEALACGYRLIDTAWAYKNEAYLGAAIRRSGIDRKELFVSSKCSNRFRGYEQALACFKESLELLRLEYLDLYLIHWPAKDGPPEEWQKLNSETWRALETLYKDGYVRAIGVSNFWPHHLEPLMEYAEIPPMVLQLEYHPGYIQAEPVAFARVHGMIVEGWSPLGTGKLLNNETLLGIGKNYNKSPAQVILNWCVNTGVIPLPKSHNEARILQNIDIFDFKMSEDDMSTLSNMEYIGGSGWTPDSITW